MMRRTFTSLALGALALTVACQKAPIPVGVPQTSAVPSNSTRDFRAVDHRLVAHVEYPADLRRRIQASAADIMTAATAQLIDPATGNSIVGGILSNGGTGAETFSLTLPESFTPALNQVFVLEVLKGLGNNAPGSAVVRLRTTMQWTANGWRSISGSTHVVNALTTAVTLAAAVSNGNVAPASIIGSVGIASGVWAYVGPVQGLTASEVTNLTTAVNQYLTADQDPIEQTSLAAPRITGMSVSRGVVSDVVAIFGDGFSSVSSTVNFNGTAASTYLVRSRNALYVTIPSGASTGNVTVTTPQGTSNPLSFTVNVPVASSISPVITGLSNPVVRPGDTLTLTGYNFDSSALQNTVMLNGVNLPVVSGNGSHLVVTIPANASSGALTITTYNGPSGAYYLGVVKTTGVPVAEAFTSASKRETGTTLDWGTSGALRVLPRLTWSQTTFNRTTDAGALFNGNAFGGVFPKAMGVGLARTQKNGNITGFIQEGNAGIRSYGNVQPYVAMAANGKVLVTTDLYRINVYKMVNGAVPSYGSNSNNGGAYTTDYPWNFNRSSSDYLLGMAAVQGSDQFYYVQYNFGSITSLPSLIITDYGVKRGPVANLNGTINGAGYGSASYAITSDGTYLYVLGGAGTFSGTAYSIADSRYCNVYKFAIKADGNLNLLEVRQNYFLQQGNYSYWGYNWSWWNCFGADEVAFYKTTGTYWGWIGSAWQAHPIYFRTQDGTWDGGVWDQYMPPAWNDSRNRNYNPYSGGMTYDAGNDCYWYYTNALDGITKNRSWRPDYSTSRNSNFVESDTLTLPSGQVWRTLRFDTEEKPETDVVLEVRRADNGVVLYTTTAENQVVDLRGTPVEGYTGNIKLRANLNTTNAYVTPYLKGWSVTTDYTGELVALSKSYDTGVVAGPVSYLGSTLDQPSGAPPVTIYYSDSADGVIWNKWTTDITQLNKRYVRWRIVGPQGTTYSGPLVNRVEIAFQS